MDLLYSLALWHGLAKLRLHSDATLAILDTWTHTLGEDVRRFESKTCQKFGTVELDKEYASRQRRKAKKTTQQSSNGKGSGKAEESSKGKGKVVERARGSSKGKGKATKVPLEATRQGGIEGENSQRPSAPLTIRVPPLSIKTPAERGTKRKKAASVSDVFRNKRLKTKKATGEDEARYTGQ